MCLATELKPRNFYDVYVWRISTKLKKIDLYLQTSRAITTPDAARLLEIPTAELARIMEEERVQRLNRKNFLKVARRGSSDICGYIFRETELCAPAVYSMDDIAYIYGLDIELVNKASSITGIRQATALTLPSLFYHIPAE